ncbi:c02439ad-a5fb-47ea-a106-26c4d8cf6a90 [Sclerotinia trifoliorum]|uniref:C02439ad-a5fb-47ea-a106-26c4d8cf6a90 n=1 Tax=Sclerotinia trifoliorum TaxID=28548 RepID=A0A8H2VU90_9HELO|nr:c02439ad-a5fb-47ea-a106-26c4d8cf6a90 [Sclerotinia trifoliorum]
MAASHSTTIPNTPDQDRISGINNTIGRRNLPGACNYRQSDISTKCGCYEFWGQSQKSIANATLEDGGFSRAEVCACGHHVCFHEPKSSQPTEDQRSRALSNVSGPNVNSIARRAQVNHRPSTPQNMSIPGKDNPGVARRSKNSNFPETLQWSRCVQSETNPEEIPPIPSQCFLPSETASMTSSQARRPFHGLGLNTLSHIPRLNTQGQAVQPGKGRPMQAYKTSDGRTFHESLTDVLSMTPTLLSTQDLPFQGVPDERAMDKTLANINIRAQDATLPLHPNRLPSFQASQTRPALKDQGAIVLNDFDGPDDLLIPRLREIVTDYPDTKRNYEERIDALENASFSNTGYEEVQVDMINYNERVYELESRVEELEKANAVADESSIGTNRNLNESFDSQTNKTSSALVSNAIDQSNLVSRVGSLEDRLTRIEAVLPPSWARPWEIEVVFLPYGPDMMGIWSTNHSMSQRSRINSCASEDWTQTQKNFLAAAQASLCDQDYSISWERMLKKSDIDDRTLLMPKACSAASTINERLKSRGLVKVVQVKGPDARDVQVALMSAFGDLPKRLSEDIYSSSRHTPLQIPAPMENFLGLRAAWIPLRKLHKTSTLRFLDPSEMVTPALWTVPFLASSVAMRTKTMRRLYVTQVDSYLQHYVHSSSGWTWHKLRQLPRVRNADSVESHTPEADAAEACWEWDERLDPAEDDSSFSTSLSIRLSQEAEDAEIEPTSPSDGSSAVDTPVESSTPTSVAVSRVKQDRHPFKPVRTASMSALAPLGTSQMGKRGIGSFNRDREPHSSPIQNIFGLKRRRTSKSPSRPRDTESIDPPSLGPSAMQEIDSKRGITPSAYATPYSNAPYVEANFRAKGSRMQEDDKGSMMYEINMDEGFDESALSDDGASDQDHQPYDVWEGMADNVPHQDSQSTIKMSAAGLRPRESMVDDGDESDSSDTPSEYPSTLPVGGYIKRSIFQIHVDEDFEDELG